LLPSHLLHLNGIESVVLGVRSHDSGKNRIRAGVLEHPVKQMLIEAGVGARGRAHEDVSLWVDRLVGLTGAKRIYRARPTVQNPWRRLRNLAPCGRRSCRAISNTGRARPSWPTVCRL